MIIKELLFPARCPVCDKVAPFGQNICPECQGAFVRINPPRCLKCGKPVKNPEEEYCYDCKNNKHIFDSGMAMYDYESINRSLYKFKYSGRGEYARYYGQKAALYYGEKLKKLGVQGIIPVPLHKRKQRIRGYNQATLFAASLSEYTNIPIYDRLIMRIRNTTPMKELEPSARQINLKNAFIIKDFDVKLDRVVIVDDIYTTGATIDAISRILREYGVKKIYFITLAIGSGI